MRNRLLTLAAALGLMFALTLPAGAVKYGGPDTNPEMFPSVGMLVFFDAESQWVCTGSVIDDNTMLTAGHCADGALGAFVNMNQTAIPFFAGALLAIGSPVAHPDFDTGFPNTFDVGVVNFPSGTFNGFAPMSIAPTGTLDDLATARGMKNTTFQITGYGVQATNGIPPNAQPQEDNDVFLQERYRGEVRLINMNSANNGGYNIQVTAAPGTGGALCFGDSGGPILHEGEIVAVNSFVLNFECAGSGFSYRVDRQEILDWISANNL